MPILQREGILKAPSIGFHEKGRYFLNLDTQFLIEFPQGPLFGW